MKTILLLLVSTCIFAQTPISGIDYTLTRTVDNTVNNYFNVGTIKTTGMSVEVIISCNSATWPSSKRYNFQLGGNPYTGWMKVPSSNNSIVTDWDLQIYMYGDSTQLRVKNVASHGGTVPVNITISANGNTDAKFYPNAGTGSDASNLYTYISFNPEIISSSLGFKPYSNTATTTSGVATFYLTSDKTAGGTALYGTNVYPNIVVNDAAANYTYGWSLSGDKKTLTVTTKVSSQNVVALVGLTLIGVPANVPNGTTVYLTCFGL